MRLLYFFNLLYVSTALNYTMNDTITLNLINHVSITGEINKDTMVNFISDIEQDKSEINAEVLLKKAKVFFKRNGLLLNWREFEKLDANQKINTLAMIAPITNEEKQKLLETVSLENKVKTLESIISFYLYETADNNQTIQ